MPKNDVTALYAKAENVNRTKVMFLSGARYTQPLDMTSAKKFRALQALVPLACISPSPGSPPEQPPPQRRPVPRLPAWPCPAARAGGRQGGRRGGAGGRQGAEASDAGGGKGRLNFLYSWRSCSCRCWSCYRACCCSLPDGHGELFRPGPAVQLHAVPSPSGDRPCNRGGSV